jgi:hypothetical protein
VGAVVIHDDMRIESGGYLRIDHIQEVAEFRGAMAAVQLADHAAGLQFQGGKQGGRAMAFVVVGAALELPGRKGNSGWVRSSA